MTDKCPVCGNEAGIKASHSENRNYVNCSRCGKFEICLDFWNISTDLTKMALSHWIRKMNMQGVDPDLIRVFDTESKLKSLELPNPAEQADNLIVFIGESARFHTDQIVILPLKLAAIIGAYKEKSIVLITSELQKQDWIECYRKHGEGNVAPDNDYKLSLTFKGWQRYEELKKFRKDSKKVFVAMGYGNSDSERLYSEFLPKIIKEDLGLELIILRDNLRSGIVDNIMREDISQSCLLLAEMTNYNRGAYWEAGFAEGLKIPVIYLCERSVFDSADKDIKPHFDVNHCTFIPWSFDTIDKDMEQLKATIRRAIPDKVKHEE